MEKRCRQGFSLIEIVLVVGIIAVVGIVGFAGGTGARNKRAVEATANRIVAILRDARNRAITQESGQSWGVRFWNTPVRRGYEIWDGVSYAASVSRRFYSLDGNIGFGNPATGTLDTVFSQKTGFAENDQIISLLNSSGELANDIIIRARGAIFYRKESGLSGYWHLDEAKGTLAYDASGGGRVASLNNGLVWTAAGGCRAGSCLNLNGSTQFVTAGSSTITGTAPFTLSAWLNAGGHLTYGLAVFMGNAVNGGSAYLGYVAGVQVGTNNSIGGGFYGRNYGSGVAAGTGWHHVVLTFSGGAGGTALLYVDGVQKTSDTQTPNLNSAAVIFGKANTGTAYWYNGLIDEVRIYNRALSPAEVQNLYNDTK